MTKPKIEKTDADEEFFKAWSEVLDREVQKNNGRNLAFIASQMADDAIFKTRAGLSLYLAMAAVIIALAPYGKARLEFWRRLEACDDIETEKIEAAGEAIVGRLIRSGGIQIMVGRIDLPDDDGPPPGATIH